MHKPHVKCKQGADYLLPYVGPIYKRSLVSLLSVRRAEVIS